MKPVEKAVFRLGRTRRIHVKGRVKTFQIYHVGVYDRVWNCEGVFGADASDVSSQYLNIPDDSRESLIH